MNGNLLTAAAIRKYRQQDDSWSISELRNKLHSDGYRTVTGKVWTIEGLSNYMKKVFEKASAELDAIEKLEGGECNG